MKTLVLYYSLEHHTKLIAQSMANLYGCDILEIECEKPFPTSKVKKFIWGGKSVVMKHKPKLKTVIKNSGNYDLICIGTPVWASSYASPIRSLKDQLLKYDKDLVFFASHGGGGCDKCFANMEKLFAGNRVLGKLAFLETEEKVMIEKKLKEQLDTVFTIKE